MAYASRGNSPFIVSYDDHGISEYKRAWNTGRKAAGIPDLLVHDLRRTAVRGKTGRYLDELAAIQK